MGIEMTPTALETFHELLFKAPLCRLIRAQGAFGPTQTQPAITEKLSILCRRPSDKVNPVLGVPPTGYGLIRLAVSLSLL